MYRAVKCFGYKYLTGTECCGCGTIEDKVFMKKNLLIIGAGIYSLVAKEIAESMGCFERIAFVDDQAKKTPNGLPVIGTSSGLEQLRKEFSYVIVAIGNASVRLRLLEQVEQQYGFQVETLISPHAYISPTARIAGGCIVEPMAVVHAQVALDAGCIVSAGAVINHAAKCGKAVHVDCNAVVAGNTAVPSGTKVYSCTVFTENK